MLIVTAAAVDPLLMTAAQMRAAAGVADSDTSKDAALALLNARISAEIYAACGIIISDDAKEPTIRQETLTETFRGHRSPLILSRRHNVEIVSVTVGGASISPDEYEVESEAGLLHRLQGDRRCCWRGTPVVVVYKAGFATVPPGLVGAASDLIRFRRSELERDPLVKSERVKVDGVDEVETGYWVNSVMSGSAVSPGAPIPPNVMAALSRFRNEAFG